MLLTILAGCRRAPQSNFEAPDYVFVPEIISMPDSINDMNNLTFHDGKFYFWSMYITDEETGDFVLKLYSMNMDGSDLAELPNYVPTTPSFEYDIGNVYIMSLNIDNNGYIWLAETGSFGRFDLPDDFDGEEWDKWEYYREIDNGNLMFVRKLDNTGAEVSNMDVSAIFRNAEYFYMRAFNLDAAGNLYIATDNEIHVLNSDGVIQFSLDPQDWIDELFVMPDGRVAYSGWMDTGRGLRVIDFAGRSWGETISLPYTANQVFSGGGDYTVLFSNGTSLFGLEADTGESVKLLNWIESDVLLDWTNSISVLPDGRILAINTIYDWNNHDRSVELILLTKTPYADLPERTVLTFATVWLSESMRSHIVNFNRTNPTYRIHIIDYSEFSTADEWDAGITRLSTDIISGNIPDILDVSQLPVQQYAARNLLVDLNPFIDSDPNLNRSDLFESVFSANEINGGLYRIFPAFSIITLGGNPTVLGPEPGWNIAEFTALMNANPQADMPLGQWLTKENFLQATIMFGMDEYVDWAAGKVHFDTGSFAELLEFANTFPAQIDYGDDMGLYIEESELIATGRQIMSAMNFWSFQDLQRYRALYGGELVFKGFPAESRNGSAFTINSGISITTGCIDNDGAWAFLREMLTAEWQRDNVLWDFPTNRVVFDEMAEKAINEDDSDSPMFGRTVVSSGIYMEDGMYRPDPVTQEDVNMLVALINSVSNVASYDEALMNIINEGAADFFSGRSSALTAANVIQDRAAILISERS